MNKVDYSDFEEKDIVSGLRRTLYLDPEQFDSLPSGDEVVLVGCKVSKMDSNVPTKTIDNIKYYEFAGYDNLTLKGLLASVKGLKGEPLLKVKRAFENTVRLKFRVNIQGGKATNAQELFNFITGHNLDENPNNKTLSGLKWHVAWCFADQYHDVLTLVVDSLADVKVQ